jgi:glycerol-3-phosphate cytidylyltransferase-like family protein
VTSLDLGHCKRVVDVSGLRNVDTIYLEEGRIIDISGLKKYTVSYIDNDYYQKTDDDDSFDPDTYLINEN